MTAAHVLIRLDRRHQPLSNFNSFRKSIGHKQRSLSTTEHRHKLQQFSTADSLPMGLLLHACCCVFGTEFDDFIGYAAMEKSLVIDSFKLFALQV
jgi:hypothetical protein